MGSYMGLPKKNPDHMILEGGDGEEPKFLGCC